MCVGVAYFRVAGAAKSVVAIENAGGAINQIAPTTHEPRRRRQADAKREKVARVINAEPDSLPAALGDASDVMMAHLLRVLPAALCALVRGRPSKVVPHGCRGGVGVYGGRGPLGSTIRP